mgnify:CR=1 FL=1
MRLLPEFLSSILGGNISEKEKNELVTMAIKQVEEISKKLAKEFQPDVHKMTKETKTRVEIEKRLQKIILLLNHKGLIDNEDEDYRSFLGKIGVITSTFGMALRMDREYELYEIMLRYSKRLISSIEEPDNIDIESIIKLLGGQSPDLN